MRIEIFTAAVLLLAAGCDRPAETPKSETPMPVRVLPVTSGNYRPSYEAVAQVKPFRTVDLVARISGFLQERAVPGGELREKGRAALPDRTRPIPDCAGKCAGATR